MKKILLLVFIGCSTFLAAQSLQILDADSTVYGNAFTTGDMEGHITVKNVTSFDVSILVKRIDANYTNLTDSNAICWGLCYATDASQTPFPLTVGAGETNSTDFIAHVYPDKSGVPETGSITYVFFNEFDPNDSTVFTMNFETTTNVSLLDREKAEKKISIFPNPLQGDVTVNYNLDRGDNVFELYNLLGTKVYAKSLAFEKGSFTFDANQFSKGVYFYTLKSNGTVVETKKLMVK